MFNRHKKYKEFESYCIVDTPSMHDDVELAKMAAKGQTQAKRQVRRIAHPIVQKRTRQLCKQFCGEHYKHFQCTVDERWGRHESEIPLCEHGNESYAWALSYLINEKRLLRYNGNNGAPLKNYFTTIIHSIPFLERWKNNRFGRRIRVPFYIQVLDPHAANVFWSLYDGDSISNIAQRLNRDVLEVQELKKSIEMELVKRQRLHLLYPMEMVSLDDEGSKEKTLSSEEIGSHPDRLQEQELVHDALSKLSFIERFVLIAMDVDGLGAKPVLKSLVEEDIQIKDGVAPEDADIDQVYYVRNRARAKLKKYLSHYDLLVGVK